MSRSLLLLLVLLAAPAWAQEFEGLVLSQGAFGANNSSVVRVSGVFAPPSSSTLAGGRIYTQGAEIIGDHLYLTAGDSFSGTSRVDVLDLGTGALVGQITQNLQNPTSGSAATPTLLYHPGKLCPKRLEAGDPLLDLP